MTIDLQRVPAVALATALALLLAVGIAVEWGDGAGSAGKDVPSSEPTHAELPSERFAALAADLRAGDVAAAERRLATLPPDDRRTVGDPGLLLGLAAFARGERGQATGRLAAAPEAPQASPFADWRLLALAELAAEAGNHETALEHYAALIAGFPASPLRAEALREAAELHARRGEPFQVLDLVDVARREELDGTARVELEVMAWRAAGTLSDDAVRRQAARRLLVHAPWRAATLEVSDLFRDSGGRVAWAELLTPAELVLRARTFLTLAQPDAARLTLDDVPVPARDLEWHLTAARAYTELARGREALAVLELAPLDAARGDDRARLLYRRALACLDLADPRRGGRALSADERDWYLLAARGHLQRSAELSDDKGLALRALRRLHATLEGESLERQRPVLEALRRRDPDDRTGAPTLWQRGWRAYRAGELRPAVAWWQELAALYPASREAHRGRYWQARTLEELGRRRQARRLYDELVAASDTTDFYRRRALVRLGAAPQWDGAAAELVAEPRPWKVDPALARAKMLSDLGLEALAAREMVLLEETAEPVDALALEALIRFRGGERRRAMTLLRAALPQLGGPTQGSVPTVLLRAYYPLEYGDQIRRSARRAGVPPWLVAGIIRQESGFDPRATSRVGARGLMQLMPPTGREMAERLGEPWGPGRLYDPDFSIRAGSAYLRQVLEMFDGNVELALAGYNGGPTRIRRLWREEGPGAEVDAFVETLQIAESRHYVKRILILADSYRQLYPQAALASPVG